jgi:hypothetical protein
MDRSEHGIQATTRARNWAIGAFAACIAALLIVAVVAGLSKSEAQATEAQPASVEPIGDGGLNTLALTAEAASRLGIKTTPVRTEVVAHVRKTVIPYSAVVYDATGASWAYTTSKPLSFVRHPIVVARVAGDLAVLSSGPSVGTQVVSVGVAELFGTEFEFEE